MSTIKAVNITEIETVISIISQDPAIAASLARRISVRYPQYSGLSQAACLLEGDLTTDLELHEFDGNTVSYPSNQRLPFALHILRHLVRSLYSSLPTSVKTSIALSNESRQLIDNYAAYDKWEKKNSQYRSKWLYYPAGNHKDKILAQWDKHSASMPKL